MNPIKKLWNYIEGINGLLLILYSIFIMSTFAFVTASGKKMFLRWVLVIIVASIIVCPLIMKFLRGIEVRGQFAPAKDTKNNIKWWLLFFFVPLILFLIKYLIYYPGAFSPDSIEQLTQALNNDYIDWHPVIQTLLSIKIPLLMTGGWIGSLALFQIIAFSLVLAYSLVSIKKYTNTRYSILALVFIMLNPQTTNMAMFPWKDVTFSMGALLLVTYVLHIYFTDGEWIKKPVNCVVFVIVAALTTLVRHNALLFTIPLLIAVFFLMAKKRALILFLCIAALIGCIKIPLYSALGVEDPGQRQVEKLGLPMTIIGAAVTYAPEQLDDEILSFAYQIAPKEVWEEQYEYGDYNWVKWDERTDNDVIEEYGAAKVLSMTLQCLKSCPEVSLKALIKTTDVVYTICDDYCYYDEPRIASNPYGISSKGSATLQTINSKVSYCLNLFFPGFFMYSGAMCFVLLASVLAKCKLNRWTDWKKILIILPVFLYNFGTALLLTGASDESRFFYYTFLITPTLLLFLYRKKKKE